MRTTLFLGSVVAVGLLGCSPPCESITPQAVSICHPADAGAIVAGAAFELRAQPNTSASSCSVAVDGGSISLRFEPQVFCASPANGAAAPIGPVACVVPALPAGAYTVDTVVPVSLMVPQGADGGVSACP